MDPFNPSAPPAAAHHQQQQRRRDAEAAFPPFSLHPTSQGPGERVRADPQPPATPAPAHTTANSASFKTPSAGLRRSAGLFNLKLDAENGNRVENNESPPAFVLTPDQSASLPYLLPNNNHKHRMRTPRATVATTATTGFSLKRPHPFSSAKPARPSGFLARSSASYNSSSGNASLGDDSITGVPTIGQKRQHLLADPVSPELSFCGAKPVQTAFMPAGLQSKKQVPQSPKPQVPETPCKRPINESPHVHHSLHHHRHTNHTNHNNNNNGGNNYHTNSMHTNINLQSIRTHSNSSQSSTLGAAALYEHSHIPGPTTASFQIRHPNTPQTASTASRGPPQRNSANGMFSGVAGTGGFSLRNSATSNHPSSSGNSLSERLTTVPARSSSPLPMPLPADEEDDAGDSPLVNHPVDRLQRFSIGHIHSAAASNEDLEPPETPTRFANSSVGVGAARTSTPRVMPLQQPHNAASTSSVATIKRPLPSPAVLQQSADPANSLSSSMADDHFGSLPASASSSPSSIALSPRTPGMDSGSTSRIIANSSSLESQSSPRPRRRGLRFGMWHSDKSQQQLQQQQQQQQQQQAHPLPQPPASDTNQYPSVPPPLRVRTPQGHSFNDDVPHTPSGYAPTLFLPTESTRRSSSSFLPHSQQQMVNRWSSANTTNASTSSVSSTSAAAAAAAAKIPHDELLAARFDRVQSAAYGEFSAVFVVVQGRQRFAVKRTKRPIHGQAERLRWREEVDILRLLASSSSSGEEQRQQEQDHEQQQQQQQQKSQQHIVQFVGEWESHNFGYLMTEFCENGDLSRFLADQGRVARLEEWRVWKILVELLQGLAVIHAHDVLHLDLKPANVFVTFEGHLKIGDFGMATRYPVPRGFEREGDREYIAPEVLERQQYGKPADVFSVGLMMVEIAANIVLPDNGVHWHRLRSGDLSDAGRLSSGDLSMASATGIGNSNSTNNTNNTPNNNTTNNSNNSASRRRPPPPWWAPKFLVDDECLLDKVVSAMLSPQPEKRPTVEQLLSLPELIFVDQRGQAGAVIYEGEFGPEPETDGETSVWQLA